MAIFTKEKGAAAAQQTSGRQTGKVWCHLGAILFAFFVVFGRSFYLSNSWALVLGSTSQLISGLVRGICWYLIFYLGYRCCSGYRQRQAAGKPAGDKRIQLAAKLSPSPEN